MGVGQAHLCVSSALSTCSELCSASWRALASHWMLSNAQDCPRLSLLLNSHPDSFALLWSLWYAVALLCAKKSCTNEP